MAAVSTNGLADDPRSRVAAVVQRHERTLLRVARQASLCHDDALDAYQRALEIFVRRVETVDPATEVAWLKVVVRHEAMAIRRARSESVTGEELDFDAIFPASGRSVDEEIAATERVRRSAEALRALKPDEAKALMMKANGLSYDEIGERNGWSYTKVNRAVTEGRRRFLAVFEGIESGEECERYTPVVEALAAGGATAAQILSIRPHLRHCGACRAAIRDLHLSRAHRIGLYWPGFLLAAQSTRAEQERLLHTLAESGTPVETPTDLKQRLLDFLHRAQASDIATGVQIAATGGGGRLATVAALVGICLTGAVGVSTVCVVAGVMPDPFALLVDKPPQLVKPHPPQAKARPAPTPATTPPPLLTARPAATSTPAPRKPRRVRSSRSQARDPAQGTKPTSHENAPITPALASSTGQETFTPEAPTGPTQPASAPATGGDEFTP